MNSKKFLLASNVDGTSELTCGCDSWIDHWDHYGGNGKRTCSEVSCWNDAIGAHVNLGTSETVEIIPLCKAHNNTGGVIKVDTSTIFVNANPKATCEK
jgi:hypothetical protein